MSFILDALKKLEKQRQRGSMPDLATVHITEPRKHRKHPLWLYLFFAALVLNAGMLALFFIPRETGKILSATSPVEHSNKQVSAISQTPSLPSEQSGSAETISSGRHDPATREPSERSKSDDRNYQRDFQSEQVRPKPVRKHKSEHPFDTDNNINANLLNNKLNSKHSSNTLPQVSPTAPPFFHQTDPNKPASQEDIPELSQLPQSVRSEIPSIKLFGHIYSDSPETRLVNINGDILREGDSVAKNITVKEITKNGVILTYGNIYFSIRAF
jgi:hypothetical protein